MLIDQLPVDSHWAIRSHMAAREVSRPDELLLFVGSDVALRQRPHMGAYGAAKAALVAMAVGAALDVPVVYEVRGFFESLWTQDTAWAERAEVYERRRAAEAHCLRQAAAVVTLSESMKDDIVARDVDRDTGGREPAPHRRDRTRARSGARPGRPPGRAGAPRSSTT